MCIWDGSGAKEGKSKDKSPSRWHFALFIKNRPKHFMYHTKVSFAGGSHEEAWPRSTDSPLPLLRAQGPWSLTEHSGKSQWAVGACPGPLAPPTPWQRLDTQKCLCSAKINKWSEMENPAFLFPRAWDGAGGSLQLSHQFLSPKNKLGGRGGKLPLETLGSPSV